MVDAVNTGLILLSSAGFVSAVYLTYTLSKETRGGRYWMSFLAASIGLGIHEWLKVAGIIFSIRPDLSNTLTEIGVVFGSFALAYGAYGIQQSVKEIKARTGG